MSEIARKQSVDSLSLIFVELHAKHESRMNQGWTYHNLYRIKYGNREEYYVEPTIKRKIKTRNYNCHEERNVEQTKCLNHFYMSKLNCTFPWLEMTKQSQEKCSSKHFIKDLVDLIDNLSTGK